MTKLSIIGGAACLQMTECSPRTQYGQGGRHGHDSSSYISLFLPSDVWGGPGRGDGCSLAGCTEGFLRSYSLFLTLEEEIEVHDS